MGLEQLGHFLFQRSHVLAAQLGGLAGAEVGGGVRVVALLDEGVDDVAASGLGEGCELGEARLGVLGVGELDGAAVAGSGRAGGGGLGAGSGGVGWAWGMGSSGVS